MTDQEYAPIVKSAEYRDAALPEESPDIFRAGIIGGGETCRKLLAAVSKGGLDRINLEIVGVVDKNSRASGLLLARKHGIFTSNDYHQLYFLPGINLLIELTGSDQIFEDLVRTKPRGVSILDRKVAEGFLSPFLEGGGNHPSQEVLMNHKDAKQSIQAILDSLPYRLMVVSDDKTVNMVNQTFLQENNLRVEDALSKHCYELRYGLDNPCAECGRPCYLEEVKKTKATTSTIHEYVGKDGKEHFDVITVSPMFNEKGEVVKLIEASRDVTQRIALEKKAQRSSIFLQNVIQSTVDGIVVVDTKGNVLIFNEGMENLTGYTAREIMENGHMSSFYNMDVAKKNMQIMRSDKHGPVGKLNATPMTISSKSGEEIPVVLSASIVKIDGQEIGSVGIFTDMRETLKMRQDLEEAHLQLVQSEKIGSVGRMAAGVAHEINNPLAGVLIYSELLKEGLLGQPELLSDVEQVIEQTLRCKKIVAELLEFSRQSVGKATSFSLEELINKCLSLLIKQASFHDILVVKEMDPSLPLIVGDMGQLQQVFTNLFINAADAMGSKGKLTVGTSFESEESRVVVKISDTGPGIPAPLQDKIFDIFYTTKPVGKGTGLGLSISQNIVNLHGGTLRFECPEEGGTTFIIELPIDAVESHRGEPVFVGMGE